MIFPRICSNQHFWTKNDIFKVFFALIQATSWGNSANLHFFSNFLYLRFSWAIFWAIFLENFFNFRIKVASILVIFVVFRSALGSHFCSNLALLCKKWQYLSLFYLKKFLNPFCFACTLPLLKHTYSCNNITTTLIQISRLFYFGFFSKTNHQMII